MPRFTPSAISVHAAPASRLPVAFVPSTDTVSGSRAGESLAVATSMPVTMLPPAAGVTRKPVPMPLVGLVVDEGPLPKLRYFVFGLLSTALAGDSVDRYWPGPAPADDGTSPPPAVAW